MSRGLDSTSHHRIEGEEGGGAGEEGDAGELHPPRGSPALFMPLGRRGPAAPVAAIIVEVGGNGQRRLVAAGDGVEGDVILRPGAEQILLGPDDAGDNAVRAAVDLDIGAQRRGLARPHHQAARRQVEDARVAPAALMPQPRADHHRSSSVPWTSPATPRHAALKRAAGVER